MRRAATTLALALALALAGCLLLQAPTAVDAKGLRMTLEATGEQTLLEAAQEAAGLKPHDDDAVSPAGVCVRRRLTDGPWPI